MGSRDAGGFGAEFPGVSGAGEEPNPQPPVELVFREPVARGGAALGPALRPRRLEGVGQTAEQPEHRGGLRLADSAFIFLVGDVRG